MCSDRFYSGSALLHNQPPAELLLRTLLYSSIMSYYPPYSGAPGYPPQQPSYPPQQYAYAFALSLVAPLRKLTLVSQTDASPPATRLWRLSRPVLPSAAAASPSAVEPVRIQPFAAPSATTLRFPRPAAWLQRTSRKFSRQHEERDTNMDSSRFYRLLRLLDISSRLAVPRCTRAVHQVRRPTRRMHKRPLLEYALTLLFYSKRIWSTWWPLRRSSRAAADCPGLVRQWRATRL